MNWKKKFTFLALLCLVETSLTLAGGRWTQTLPGVPLQVFVDPADPAVLYATGLGVFRSTDRGVSWAGVNTGLTSLGVAVLAMEPGNSSTLYAGAIGGGVFKSTDNGSNWVALNHGLTDLDVLGLVIDLTDPSVVYAGTDGGGVFESLDGGASWVAINNGLAAGSLGVIRLISDPTEASTLYAGTYAGLFQSQDRGTQWTAITNGLPEGAVLGLAIDPTNPSILYVANFGEGLFKSTDRGASWVAINNGVTDLRVQMLILNPANPSTLYAGTLEAGVFRSTDAGASWVTVSNGLSDLNVFGLAVASHNPSTVYAGTLRGPCQSTDEGDSWTRLHNGLTNGVVEVLALDPTGASTLYAGTNGGGVFKSTDRGATWGEINEGLTHHFVRALIVDPGDPSVLYVGTNGAGVFKSTDRGDSWTSMSDGLTNSRVRTLAIDPTNSSILYVGTLGGAFRSTEMGTKWAPVNGLPETAVSALSIDPDDTSILYTGTSEGLFKSTDRGATWTVISDLSVSELVLDPGNTSTLYAATFAGVFRSTDGGDNWFSINKGLTDLRVPTLVIDPAHTSTLYAGTFGDGVFQSTDRGDTWEPMKKGLTVPVIYALAVDLANPSTVYAGTGGGGVYLFVEEPRWLYAAGNPAGVEARFDGLALTNFSGSEANLDLEAITSRSADASLELRFPEGNANETSVILQAGEQTARLRTDLFEGDPSEPAWIELTSDTPRIGTFFQFGTDTLSQLDGGVAINETSSHLVFTRISDGPGAFRGQTATTRISILNPHSDPVTLELNYLQYANGAGFKGASTLMQTIEGRSFLDERVTDLFPGSSSAGPLGDQLAGGAISVAVTEGEGVVGFEVIQLKDQSTVLGLNAASGNPTHRAYSAQLASQPGLFTSVNVINTSDEPRNVTLRAVREDGSEQGNPVLLLLDPGEQFTEDAGVLFGGAATQPSQAESFIGSLIVEADGDGVAGDVIFGDSQNFGYAASLPLQTEAFTEAVFNQVANVSGFFTGLAFFYPEASPESSPEGPVEDAEITIHVFLPDGEMVGKNVVTLAVGQRISKLVEELVGEIELAGGYVRIFSTEQIIGQMLFGVVGPGGIQLFSAVPPTLVQ